MQNNVQTKISYSARQLSPPLEFNSFLNKSSLAASPSENEFLGQFKFQWEKSFEKVDTYDSQFHSDTLNTCKLIRKENTFDSTRIIQRKNMLIDNTALTESVYNISLYNLNPLCPKQTQP